MTSVLPAPLKTRYTYDTEFNEAPGYLDLISIGVKCEDGRDFYAVSSEFDKARCDDFVLTNVLSRLGPQLPETRAQIRDRLLVFIGKTRPEFWGYFADYDHVVLCWLFGRMIDLPKGWPKLTLDLKQTMIEKGVRESDLPKKPANAHNALDDARWNMDVLNYLRRL